MPKINKSVKQRRKSLKKSRRKSRKSRKLRGGFGESYDGPELKYYLKNKEDLKYSRQYFLDKLYDKCAQSNDMSCWGEYMSYSTLYSKIYNEKYFPSSKFLSI